MFRTMNFLNLFNKDVATNERNEGQKFHQIKEEFNEHKADINEVFDDNTQQKFRPCDIGLKNFAVGMTMVDCQQFQDISYGKPLLFLKFKRTNDKHTMSLNEVKQYISIENGELKFKKPVKPEQIYKIAKTLNNEFYFAVNCYDNVVPMSNFQAKQIFKNNSNVLLNKHMHIKKITDQNTNDTLYSNDISDAFVDWFNNNVLCSHPYAYSNMVITEQVKRYNFVKKDKNGKNLNVKTQFSNELTDKYLTEDNLYKLKDFVRKCQIMHNKARKNKEEHVFALPFPLYSKEHMLSIVMCFKPNGDINITIINANGLPEAQQEYAIPISNMIQKAFEKYSTSLPDKTSYFFHENNSQFGGTCLTHADCITKQIVKDPEFEKDGHDLHPIKILEKAYIRGCASTLYQKAVEQGKFIPDNMMEVNKENRGINNVSNIDKASRDFLINRCNFKYKQGYKQNNTQINTSKTDRDNFIVRNNHYYDMNIDKQANFNILKDKNDYFIDTNIVSKKTS